MMTTSDIINSAFSASKKDASIDVLEKLSQHKSSFVVTCVAQNPNTPISILEKLVKDKRWMIRRAVSINKNHNIPALIFKELAFDKDYRIWRDIPHIKKLTRRIEK